MKTTINNTITVNAQELLNKLNSIKTVKNRKYKPILKIQSGENSGLTFLNVGKYLNYVETDLKCESESENEVYVNFYDFLDTVKDLNGLSENIIISVDENNDIQVTADYLSVKLDNLDEIEWKDPNREIDYKNNKYFKFNTMNKTEFRKLIKDFEYLKKHSDIHNNYTDVPVVKGVNFKVDNNVLTMEAIDGFRVMISEYPIIDNNENFDFIISPETLDILIKVLKNNIQNENVVGIERTEKGLVIGVNDIIIYGQIMEGNFFNVDQINSYKREPEIESITFDKKKLEKILNMTKKYKNKYDIPVAVFDFSCQDKMVTIKDCDQKNLEAKFEYNGVNNTKFGLQPKFLLEVMNNISDNKITFNYPKEFGGLSPVYIFDTNNEYIVLPVRVNN